MLRHWSVQGPPAYIAVAAYLGLRQASPGKRDVLAGEDLINFLSQFPGAVSR